MESSLHRFIRFLRLHGMRVSVAEAVDALEAASQPGIMAEREVLRSALAVTLVKDRRDQQVFDEVFERFFRLRRVVPEGEEHGHAHDDLSDDGELSGLTISDELSDTPQQGHSHGKPQDIREFFRPEDLAQQYNLHQEANKIDMASMTDEVVLSKDGVTPQGEAARVQVSTSRLHNPGTPGRLTEARGAELGVELTVAEELALLSWLGEPDDELERLLDDPDVAALRDQLAPLLAGLPEQIKRHLEQLMAGQAEVEERELDVARAEVLAEPDRLAFEEAVRRLLRALRGAPRPAGTSPGAGSSTAVGRCARTCGTTGCRSDPCS
ncbi:hypothetical protein [Phycicoccus sp. HDW14]|uniref:hypothetical protein n=1 Tax=Phycicoccus sp. HDW14 TaxID=2714941 RepID=UPI00197B8516|nr:hypothetical protein [Phycicoccus sp. HDW14]